MATLRRKVPHPHRQFHESRWLRYWGGRRHRDTKGIPRACLMAFHWLGNGWRCKGRLGGTKSREGRRCRSRGDVCQVTRTGLSSCRSERWLLTVCTRWCKSLRPLEWHVRAQLTRRLRRRNERRCKSGVECCCTCGLGQKHTLSEGIDARCLWL